MSNSWNRRRTFHLSFAPLKGFAEFTKHQNLITFTLLSLLCQFSRFFAPKSISQQHISFSKSLEPPRIGLKEKEETLAEPFLLETFYVNLIVISCFWISRSAFGSYWKQNETKSCDNKSSMVQWKEQQWIRDDKGTHRGWMSFISVKFFIISTLNNNLFLFIWILCRLRFIRFPSLTILLPLRSATGIFFPFSSFCFTMRGALWQPRSSFFHPEPKVNLGKLHKNKSVDAICRSVRFYYFFPLP